MKGRIGARPLPYVAGHGRRRTNCRASTVLCPHRDADEMPANTAFSGWARLVSNQRPLACEAWRSWAFRAMKYLQIRPNREAGKCQALVLVRPNTAGFGPTNGPTARSAHETMGWQVACATVAITGACIGAAARRIVTSGTGSSCAAGGACRGNSMRQVAHWLPTAHDRRIPSTNRWLCQGRSKMHPFSPVENAPPCGCASRVV
jgi:hypothetical protein